MVTKLTIRPLTPDLWPALEDLFGPKGACSGFYVRIGYRKKGVTAALIAAAVKAARRAKAPALEAYPLDADKTPSASSTGFASTFKRAGFKTIARHVPPRPIMRLDLKADS